jgi:Helix-turn-helix domain
MSVQAMAWAMDQEIIKNPTARHVLLVLANYADVNGKAAFPSADTLVRQTGLSERAVRNKLVEMEGVGVIVRGNQAIVEAYIDRGDRRPICYDLAMPQDEKRGARNAPRKERGAPHSTTGCTSFQDGVHVVPERGAGGAPNPSSNPSFNPPIKQNRSDDRANALVDGAEKKVETMTGDTWNSYALAYELRYGTKPVRNATVNAQVAGFVKRLGVAEAPEVAAFYVSHNNRFYVQTMHSAGAMVKDAEKLRTEWATSTRVTETKAREADRLQTSGDMWSRLIEQAEAAHGGR